MSSDKSKRRLSSCVRVPVFKEDLDRLKQEAGNSGCRSLGEYCRKLLLGKPVTTFYRNRSFDGFVDEVIILRNNMEQLRQLPLTKEGEVRLIALQEEIKKCIIKIYDHVCQNKG